MLNRRPALAGAAGLAFALSACGQNSESSSERRSVRGSVGIAMPTRASERWLTDVARRAQVALRSNSRDLQLRAAVQGLGLACLPCYLGDPEPDLLSDLDGERVGRAVPQEIVQIRMQQMGENSVNWVGVGAPNEGPAR